jgi:hypothetical protein
MTSSATFHENKSKTIHTAACLIIGDEVLGGKVHPISYPPLLISLTSESE